MNRRFAVLSLALCLSLCLSLVTSAMAQTSTSTASALPRLVRFGGVVKDLNGNPLTGVVGITFALYGEQTGGAPLWLETQNVTADSNGHYTALLGSTKPNGLPPELFTSVEARWVGVQVSGQAEQPRVLLVSAPYAFKAGDAETIGGLPPSAFVLAAPPLSSAASTPPNAGTTPQSSAPPPSGAVTGTGTVNFLPLWDSTSDIISSVLFQSGTGSAAKIGINTTTPASTLDVKGGATIRGILSLPTTGPATATAGKNSQPLNLAASAFNSTTSTAVNQTFQWQTEPAGNDTSTPSGTLNLLFGEGATKPSETGLHIASNGQITFVTDQAFTGNGSGLTNVTAANSTELGGLAPGAFAQLATANTFTGTQTINTITGNGLSGTTSDSTMSGVVGTNLATTGNAFGVYGQSNSATGTGVDGYGSAAGVSGTSNSATGSGVVGVNTLSSGSGIGVYGKTTTSTGYGVEGFNSATTGIAIGAYGLSNSTAGYGVFGVGNVGVFGETTLVNGAGVQGDNFVTTGSGNGVSGYTLTPGGTGVVGQNGAATTTGYGVYGSSSNTGVYGIGTASGVTGSTASATGAGVVGINTAGGNAGSFQGNVGVTGNLSISASNSSSYQIGGVPFAFGSATFGNAFLGFAGNSTGTGQTNTASGRAALQTFTQGGGNTATGDAALYANTIGNSNTAIGESALQWNITGSDNTALGAGAGPDNLHTSLSNSTAVGANAVVTESNALVLGGTGSSAVSVGIGTPAPTATLDVRDNGSGGNTISAISGAVNNAVFGQNTSTSGLANGAAFSTASPQGTAVVGVNSAGGYAAYFEGNVNVTGSLSKGSGSFKIDHPLDPANKYLYHSFVESPDMMNVYNGNIATDGSGLATVTLPDWFEALNRDFRYQLTVIGQFAQAIVASEVSHNQFTIRTDKPNVKVSWQVTGIRQDAYANAHRIQVEVKKPPQELGRYLHPELFGAPAEQAIGYHAAAATQR